MNRKQFLQEANLWFMLTHENLLELDSRWRRGNRLPYVNKTPDRLGDYLVALRNDFVETNRACRRGLKLRWELNAYEKETRALIKLASTGRVVDILLRFGRVVESYIEVLGIEMTEEIRQWREQLDLERQERLRLQMELLTLLKHDVMRYEELLTPDELNIMSDVYDQVVNWSEVVLVGDPPSWFLSPSDVQYEQGDICYLDAVRVSKCETGDVVRAYGGGHQCWEDEEEACLRQATVWADLNHPYVAKMLGACHIGKEPFVVHELAEPLVSNRTNAQSWESVLGWALGLQYLHERQLGFKNFDDIRLLARHQVTSSGVLSGLGLVPVKRKVSASLQRGGTENDEDDLHELYAPTWSVPNDIFAFGLAIYNTRQWGSMFSDEKVLVLPPDRPQFLNEDEWDLVERMCGRNPEWRVSMNYVVHQLRVFVKAAELLEIYKKPAVDLSVGMHQEEDLSGSSAGRTYKRVDDFIVRTMNETVALAMPRLERMCDDMPEASKTLLQHVVERLTGVRAQLQTRENANDSTAVMEGFVDILDLFYEMLTQRNLGQLLSSSCAIASFCASRVAMQNVSVFHHEIDRLLSRADLRDAREDTTESIDSAPDWQIKANKIRREQLRAFQARLLNTEELKQQLSDPKDRLEAQMLLQFELHKRRSSYPNSVLEAIAQALKFDTDVVLKIPTSSSGSSEEDVMELFRREADHWFMLNHQNVVRLYGACHVGTLFFVCELAQPISLKAHVESLAHAKPGYHYEEHGGDQTDTMGCLVQMGLGLKYTHERGIVHCDLKGNNFMVGTDGKTIKLGDFGESVLKRSATGRRAAHANVGAVRWKAPEYLMGEDPTVMSDIYEFGMCILELFSGNIPWGKIDNLVVEYHVTKRKTLPPRPKKLTDFQWSLIQHMCCYDPSKRISLDAVVDMLHTFRFG
ncbi:kinase suppressor of Ras 2 [Phytophthora pseudosyringae]|uniref:Kinase suppressor of Ras 2 n=1 Tax=Phytophthora pseudosyringae TaxID=221518 RepID=A0A8T1VTC3_9STRA|nr:kinase suppressor of Ras 2 [Phytophthora pseudosyringae]